MKCGEWWIERGKYRIIDISFFGFWETERKREREKEKEKESKSEGGGNEVNSHWTESILTWFSTIQFHSTLEICSDEIVDIEIGSRHGIIFTVSGGDGSRNDLRPKNNNQSFKTRSTFVNSWI